MTTSLVLNIDQDWLAQVLLRFSRDFINVSKDYKTMANALDDLTAQVAATHTAIDSAVVLISGIADRVAAAGTDPAALAALTADLHSETDALAAAVTAAAPVAADPNAATDATTVTP